MIGWLRRRRRQAARKSTRPAAPTTRGATMRRDELPVGSKLMARLPWPSIALAAGLSAGLCAFVLVLAHALDRPAQRVLVEGGFQRVSPPEIERVVMGRVRGGLASIDLDALRREIEALPWVDTALVQRRWPDAVRVVVVEQTAAARWNDRGLLNTRGELFIRNARHLPPELPLLEGPDGSEARVAQLYIAAQGRLLESGLRLSGVRLDERGAWELHLNDGVIVRLGRQTVEDRLERFIGLASPMVAKRMAEIDYVDMRYTNGFSVGWNSRSALAVAPREGATTDG